MNAVLVEATDRRSRQEQVEALLRELADKRRELYRLKAFGVQPAGARDQKRAFLEVSRQLHDVVA
jgi:hypothetical protein